MARLYRSEEADVGTTVRKALTPTQRLKMFEAHKGMCVLCGAKIHAGKPWVDEHLTPLSQGGSNDMTNRGPAHKACADTKTFGSDGDLATTAKSKRQKIRHLGIHKPKGRPMAGTKASGLKRRMDGTVVRRNSHGEA